MLIHHRTPPKPRLEEMHHAPLRLRHHIHESLFLFHLAIRVVRLLPQLLGPRDFRVELLAALSAVGAQRRVGVDAGF